MSNKANKANKANRAYVPDKMITNERTLFQLSYDKSIKQCIVRAGHRQINICPTVFGLSATCVFVAVCARRMFKREEIRNKAYSSGYDDGRTSITQSRVSPADVVKYIDFIDYNEKQIKEKSSNERMQKDDELIQTRVSNGIFTNLYARTKYEKPNYYYDEPSGGCIFEL